MLINFLLLKKGGFIRGRGLIYEGGETISTTFLDVLINIPLKSSNTLKKIISSFLKVIRGTCLTFFYLGCG